MGRESSFSAPPANPAPSQLTAGATGALTLSTLAAASAFVRSGAQLISGFTGITSFVYVSPSGDDTTGARNSLALPCQTIAQALTLSSAGDTIFLAPGTYTENVSWPGATRSLMGCGSRVSIISGTFGLTATANGNAETMNISDVQITGVGTITFAAKTGGDVSLEMRGCILGSAWTFTRPVNGSYTLGVYDTRNGNKMQPDGFNNVIVVGCEFGTLQFAASGGAEVVRVHGSKIDTVTFSGAGSTLRLAAVTIVSALTCTDGFGGVFYTTGCEMRTATITINSGTWYEYGCTFVQSNIAGASGNKRVSYQRKASTNCAGGGTTTITLPIPLGATDYHVSATPTGTGSAGTAPDWYITNKTGTQFDVVLTTDFDTPFEFGIFYRVA